MRWLLICVVALPSLISGQAPEHIEYILSQTHDQWLTSMLDEATPSYFENPDCSFDPVSSSSWLEIPVADHDQFDQKLIDGYCEELVRLKSLSDLYFPLFDKKIASLQLDSDYRYLSLLSGLNVAYQGDYDKVGLWQLNYATAIRFGLRVDEVIDERMAADISTDAALAYLKFLHKKYEGDALKVFLAFTRSTSYVEKKVAEQHRRDMPMQKLLEQQDLETLWFLNFLKESFGVMKVENALFDYIDLLNLYGNVAFRQDVSFHSLEKVLGPSAEQISQANPVFHAQSIPKGYRGIVFILPHESLLRMTELEDSLYQYENTYRVQLEASIQKELEEIKKGVPDLSNRDTRTYTVRSGDVLGSIASRYGVRVSDIKSWNDLRGDMIYVGQKLVLYPKKGKADTPTPTPERTQTEATPTGDYVEYTVQPGESLWLIARKFPGISAENIMEWNEIDDNIRPGQVLKIYK